MANSDRESKNIKLGQPQAAALSDRQLFHPSSVEALERLIEQRRNDRAFRTRVRSVIERDRAILEDLAR